MQKKILLSLLVASPATLPALANINYGHGEWESSGLSSDDQVKINNEKGDVSCVLGSGPTKWIVKNLLPGKYQLSFQSVTNLSVAVSQNGKEVANASNETKVEFTVAEKGEVTIAVNGITANPYSFTGAELQLVFDFPAAGDALQTQLNGIEAYVVITDETFPGAKELLERKADLVANAAEYQKVIDDLKDTSLSDEKLEKLYTEQELYKDPSAISENIDALAKNVKAWNEKANALNTKIQNTAANKAAKAALLAAQNNLLEGENGIDALIKDIKGGSQYASKPNLNPAEALKTKIKAYATTIEEAYADDKLGGEIEFESQEEALQEEINDLRTKWNADEADWKAYQTFMNTVYPDLQNEYNGAVKDINALSGLKGFETVFDVQKEKAKDDVDATLAEYKAKLNITEAKGAAALLEGDQQTVADAKAAFQKIVAEITNLVTTQNENKTTADTTRKGFKTTFKEYESYKEIVPSSLKEEYKTAVANVQAALDDLDNYVFDNYQLAKLNLESDDYTAKVTAVQTALDALKNILGPVPQIDKLKTQFEDAKKYVQEKSDELTTEFINLYGLFTGDEGAFTSIENAIKKLTTQEEVDNQESDIKKAIETLKTTADNLYEAFTVLQAADAQYVKDVESLEAFVKAKVEIDKTGKNVDALKKAFMAEDGDGGKFEAAQQKFNTDLKALASGEKKPQAIYDAAMKLQKENVKVTGEGEDEKITYLWEENLDAIKLAFAQEVTDSNKTNLDAYLQTVKDYVAEGEYAGQDTLDFSEIDTKVAEIADAIAAAKTTEDYGTADDDIVKLISDIDTVNTLAKKYKDNQADYDALIALLGDSGLQEKIDKLSAQNARESSDNGKTYFDNIINGEDNENSIQAQHDEIKTALDKALAAYADPEEKDVTEQKAEFEAKIKALSDLIDKTATDITNNNTYHNQQLNTAEGVAQNIVTAFDTLENFYKDQAGVKDWYDKTKAALTDLRDVDLFNNNLAVADAYGKGESYTNDKVLTDEYRRINTEVENLVSGMTDKYTQAVKDANTAVEEAAGWDATKKAMNTEYVSAITTFNHYYYGLTNPGWKAAVLEVVQRHQDIYQYSQKINELIAGVNAFIKDCNETPVTFTAEEFSKEATEKADSLIKEMKEKVDALNTQIAELAVTYYDKNHETAETQINGYQDKLDAAGITGNYLDAVKKALKDAESKYAPYAPKGEGTEGEGTEGEEDTKSLEPLGFAMDRIADDLDEAQKTVNLQEIAVNAWTAAYNDAKTQAANIFSALNDKTAEDYKFADEDTRNNAIDEVEENIQNMDDLDDKVSDVTEDLIGSYKGYKDQLDALLAAITTSDKNVKDNSANNKANEDLYNTLVGTTIPDLEDLFKALEEYSESLAGGQTFNLGAIESQINALKNYVESKPGNLKENEDAINTQCETIKAAIEAGYPQIGNNEYTYLSGTLLNNVKVAFNDAKAAFNDAEGTKSLLDKEKGEGQLNDWNNQIDELALEVAALNEMLDPNAEFNKKDFQDKAQELEKALADLYVAMEQTWTGDNHDGSNPAADVIAALEKQYDEVKQAIATAQDYLNNCQEGLDTTEFAAALTQATSDLDGEKADWESVGNRVISMQPTYEAAMDEIAGNVADTLAALKAANDKAIAEAQAKAANDAAYASLSGELNKYRSELERVANLAKSWYGEDYDGTVDYITSLINAAQEALDAANEKVELTGDDELLNGGEISYQISTLENKILRRKAKATRDTASSALTDAASSLSGHFVPEELESLQKKLGKLQVDYNTNYTKETNTSEITTAGYYEVIEEYERIAQEAANLQADAVASAYVPGDVELNPDGLVTAADVQQIITWVLEGTTWQELEETNARQAYAADLNGDKTLNITDVTLDIAAVFGEDVSARKLSRFAAPAFEPSTGVGVMLVSESNGVRRYAVTLDNTMPIIAGQLDLNLPAGARIKDIAVAERCSAHEVQSMEHGSDMTRVAIYSMDNAEFESTTGAILYVDVEGRGDLSVDNVAITDTYFNTHVIDTKGSSFVDTIMDNAKEMGTRIYNAAGMMFNKLQKGINIIRDSNGKVRKEYNRK